MHQMVLQNFWAKVIKVILTQAYNMLLNNEPDFKNNTLLMKLLYLSK
jgi:hypothetical protein